MAFYDWPRMTAHLRHWGYGANHKRGQHLMQLMGMQAIYLKPKMNGPGPALNDIFIERLWRTVKYEDLKDCASVPELDASLQPSTTNTVLIRARHTGR